MPWYLQITAGDGVVGVGGVEIEERDEADQEVPIAGRNSTETMKIFFSFCAMTPSAQTSGRKKREKGGGGLH